jgi:hypothetical protein
MAFHAARRTGHEHRSARFAVNQQSQIKFAPDVQSLFDQQPLHRPSLRTGLCRHQVHSQDVRSNLRPFIRGPRQFYAAALAAASRVNLRLHHHDRGFQPLRSLARFFLGVCHFAPRSGYAIARKDSFSLVFVDLHLRFCLFEARSARADILCDDRTVHRC